MGAWAIAVTVGGLLAAQAPQRLVSGSGELAGTMSARVGEIVAREFEGGEAQSLVLVYRKREEAGEARDPQEFEDRLVEGLGRIRGVAGASSAEWLTENDTSAEAGGIIALSLDAADALASEQLVEPIRQAVAESFDAMGAEAAAYEWAITGRAAISRDINVFSTRDTARAELFALPIAFAVLLYAFGSLVAAALPLMLAVAARTVALAAIVAITALIDVSNLALSIATMISLALGIDYSLFVYHRYRELRHSGNGEEASARGAMEQSGQVVLYSGFAVAIGMGSLLLTDSLQVRSIGLAGSVAVATSVAASLTLLPSALSLLRKRLVKLPKPRHDRGRERWRRWGSWTVAHPWSAIILSLALFALLAAPIGWTRFGFPEDDLLPHELESARGLALLEEAGAKGLVSPVQVLVSARDGQRLVSPQRREDLSRLIGSVQGDRRVAFVQAPSLRSRPAFFPLPVNPDQGLVSRDDARILLRVVPANDASLAEVRELAGEIVGHNVKGASILVGGQAQYFNDFEDEMTGSFGPVVGLVLALSGFVLLALLRAPLAALKSIVLNLLSVAAGYGMVVWVFQLGHGAAFFGLPEPAQVVTPSVPIVIFAILFGLSMDYEIFLISRIRALYLNGADNSASIIEGLADTGAVITQAALIMAIVFGAFAFSRLLLVQMIGLGLAVAIVLDATVIRSVLGPALMTIAGRWNWWPLQRP